MSGEGRIEPNPPQSRPGLAGPGLHSEGLLPRMIWASVFSSGEWGREGAPSELGATPRIRVEGSGSSGLAQPQPWWQRGSRKAGGEEGWKLGRAGSQGSEEALGPPSGPCLTSRLPGTARRPSCGSAPDRMHRGDSWERAGCWGLAPVLSFRRPEAAAGRSELEPGPQRRCSGSPRPSFRASLVCEVGTRLPRAAVGPKAPKGQHAPGAIGGGRCPSEGTTRSERARPRPRAPFWGLREGLRGKRAREGLPASPASAQDLPEGSGLALGRRRLRRHEAGGPGRAPPCVTEGPSEGPERL